MEKQQELKRTLGFFPALSTVMGTVIGAGVFFKAGAVAADTGNVGLHMLAWVLGGIISICGGLTAAELAAAIPETGGMIKWVERAFGKSAAFLLTWAQTVIYFPANIAALAYIFGQQVSKLLGIGDSWTVPVAIIVAIVVAALNALGSRAGGIVQSVALVMKLIPLAFIVIWGLFVNQNNVQPLDFLNVGVGGGKSLLPALGAALLATMFAYDGWIYAGNVAGEMKNPAKHLPRAIVLGIAAIMVVYLLVNTAFIRTIGFDALVQNTGFEPNNVASVLFGGFGGKLVSIGIMISVFGTINGYTMTGMRAPFALAINKDFPFSNFFGKLSTTKVPVNAAIVQAIIASIMMVIAGMSSNAFGVLTDMLVFVIWIFYTLVFIGVFILRKREPDLERPYKVPLYPVIPAFAIFGGLIVLVMTLVNSGISLSKGDIVNFLVPYIGLFFTAIGIPVYLSISKKK